MRRVAAERARALWWQRGVAAAAVAAMAACALLLGWGELASAEWLSASDVSVTGIGQSFADLLAGLGETRVELTTDWVPAVPDAPLVLALAMLALAVNAAVAWRWRGLATRNLNLRGRAVQ
jgi:hypothetical protein